MITDYTSRKNEVLAAYERFEKTINSLTSIAKEAELPDPIEQLKASLKDAQQKAENIRADRFRLMIAGEAKSGKSTFINAYLGVELLPMDVKQCTSSIIELKYGDRLKLISTYSDGRTESIDDEEAVRRFLKDNAALNDKWRDIPVPTINHEILVKAGLRGKGKGREIHIPEGEIKDLLAAPEVQAANIHNIVDYNAKIRRYINEKKDKWKNIVTKIEIYFPFNKELKGIEIIDSPGVCARGGVAEITSAYIEKANAIIFLKPISGQALESSQFNEFLKNASVERNREALFLVLTRATNVTPAELNLLKEEARKQFSTGILQEHNIIIVDSKAELYANRFGDEENIQGQIRLLNAEGTLDDFVKSIWFDAMGDKLAFLDGLRHKSGFVQINEALSTFGRKAHYIAFSELLGVLSKVYNRVLGDLQFQIDILRQKAEDPIKLAKKIGEIKKELENIQLKMNVGVNEIIDDYAGEYSPIKKKAESAVENFKKKVASINPDSENAFEMLETQSFQKIDEFKKLQKELQHEVVGKCNNLLVALSDASAIPYTSLEPDFSEETFRQIKKSTEKKAVETRSYEEGVTFKETKTYSIYSRPKHFGFIKNNISERLDKIKNDLMDNLGEFVRTIGDQYIFELTKTFKEKCAELDAIEKAKMNAERIQIIIRKLEDLRSVFSIAVSENNKLNGGIKKYEQPNRLQ